MAHTLSGQKSPTRSSWAASRSSAGAELCCHRGAHVVAEEQELCHQVSTIGANRGLGAPCAESGRARAAPSPPSDRFTQTAGKVDEQGGWVGGGGNL